MKDDSACSGVSGRRGGQGTGCFVEPEAAVAGSNFTVNDGSLVLDQPARGEPNDVDQEIVRGTDVRVWNDRNRIDEVR
jgi:hypothetical protein